MNIKDVDMSKVSPMMKQYIEIKNQNPDVVIFFRLGDFYEMFFEDAIKVSHDLELTLTGKNAGLDERIPMCGVPHHAANLYIEKLIDLGYKIGICEQLEDPKTTKGLVKRDLIQVISKGTIMNDESLVANENNYIASINDYSHAYLITYADISTGELYASIIEHDISKLIAQIVSIGIKEVIMNNKVDKAIMSILKNQFKIAVTITDDIKELEEYSYIYQDIDDIRYVESVKYLLTYITNTQKRSLSHLQKLVIKENKNYLKMDIHTKRNLELTETLRLKQRNYSLIWLLDKTKTAMGSRMLKNYLENPIIDKEELNKRYDMIDILLKEFLLKEDLNKLLYEVYDLERLSGRVAFGNCNAKDLLQLKNSLKVLPDIKKILDKIKFYKNVKPLNNLYDLLEQSIYENPPMGLKEGYLIKDGYNSELDELKSLRKGGKDFVANFEQEEKMRTGIKNLKVGYNRVFGYYIEVSKGNTNLIKPEYGYERRQTLSNCERYISPILKEKESLILNAEERIIELEYNLFIEIREEIKKYIPELQVIAKTISEIDVIQALSTVAEENNFIRPVLTDARKIELIDNRHPVVEKVINVEYVPNDIVMDENTNILLITGPNMAGKSTYMRQLAITIILAQIGSFVPAKKAILPIFDAIYTRIGASDDLVGGESTFMVEMNEANNAIQNATENSLILFDELGRGTATFDGMALAQSILEYISQKIKCKTLFSTHYHELTDLDNTLPDLKNVHVSAVEENGVLTFLHKVTEGSIDKSYGIHVAKLANLPDVVTKRADEILKVYENKEAKRDKIIVQTLNFEEESKENELEKDLKEIDVLSLTPIEAMNKLYELKEKIK